MKSQKISFFFFFVTSSSSVGLLMKHFQTGFIASISLKKTVCLLFLKFMFVFLIEDLIQISKYANVKHFRRSIHVDDIIKFIAVAEFLS